MPSTTRRRRRPGARPRNPSNLQCPELRAAELGFDSVQALLRYMAKAVVDKRRVTFGEDDWGELSPKAAARLERIAQQAREDHDSGKLRSFSSAQDALDYLNDEKRRD